MSTAMRRLAGDILRLLGSNVAVRAVGIVALAVYARLLSPIDLAALPVFLMLGAFTNVPFHCGLFSTMVREIPPALKQDADWARGLIRTSVLVTGSGVLVMCAVYVAGSAWIAGTFFHDAGRADLIRWMVLGCGLRGVDEILTYVLRATREFSRLASKKLISELGQPAFALLLVPTFGVRGLIAGQTIGLALGVCYSAIVLRRYLFASARLHALKPLLWRSRAYYVEGGVFFATQQGDQVVVGALMSPTALAGYYIARRLIDAMSIILYTFEETMAPSLAHARHDRTDLVSTREMLSFGVAAFVLPAGALACALAPTYTRLMGAGAYPGVVWSVALLSLTVWPLGVTTVTWQLALALGAPTDRLRITTVFAVLLLASTVLTANFGLAAVASARLGAMIITAIVGVKLTARFRPRLSLRHLGSLAGATIALVIPVAVVEFRTTRYSLVGAASVLGGAVFFGVLLLLTSRADRLRVKNFVLGRAPITEDLNPGVP